MSPSLIPFLVRTGYSLFRLNRDAKKAGKIFETELIDGGIDREMAQKMKEDYLESSRFLKMLYDTFKENVNNS